jgi:ribosomal protein S18 acetylase RimI-like enzyme
MCPESRPEIAIRPAGADEMATVRALFREYADWLQVDLCFQGFEAELAGLPGAYRPPGGGVWLAETIGGEGASGELAGVVALRPIDGARGEMKRLWVRPGFRGLGLGRRLAETVIEAARRAGYRHLCLDTLEQMQAAHGLYRQLGFGDITPYYDNPLDGVRYLALDL